MAEQSDNLANILSFALRTRFLCETTKTVPALVIYVVLIRNYSHLIFHYALLHSDCSSLYASLLANTNNINYYVLKRTL